MGSEIVGRAAELGALDVFLERVARGPAAIVFEGLPGIGKTSVWEPGIARARVRSLAVLSCRPVEAEAKLAFASLTDLLEPVADRILAHLNEPQRIALEIALMRASPSGAEPSARAVATALLSGLRVLAAASPLVLAIDDQQWLDRPSAEALAFAVRRLRQEPIGVMATVRVEGDATRDPLGLHAGFPGPVERARLGALSLSALHHVIRMHLQHVFPRPTLRRITETSAGNPFFALELARALQESAAQPVSGEGLPVPDTLSSLVSQRLDRLPKKTRAVLLSASALPDPTRSLLARLIDPRDVASAIAQGQRARLIEVHDDQIRFAHPVFASAVYASAAAEQRRDVHRQLAAVVTEAEERARHLALGAAKPDEDVACALDEAALLARRRGAPDAAGELQEQAARLTPAADAPAVHRRRTQAAAHFFHAGACAQARALLQAVLAEEGGGTQRTTALHLLGRIDGQEDDYPGAIRQFEEALTHCDDMRTSVAIRLDLAFATYSAGDLQRAIAVARDALADAEQVGDNALIASILAILVMGEFMAGLGSDHTRMARALALEDRERECQMLLRPTSVAGMLAVYEGRIADAELLLRSICDWAKERGEESGIPFLLFNLSRVAWLRGDLAGAAAHAEEAMLLAAQMGSDRMRLLAVVHRSRARAAGGDIAGARADLAEARSALETTAFFPGIPWLLASEGLLELMLGDAAAAARAMEPLVAMIEASGVREPMQAYYLPDAIEALVATGELTRAHAVLEPFARRARELDRRWAIAHVVRCRSLLAAAHGDLDAALRDAEDAVERWQAIAMPIELGRALISLGVLHRRRAERRAARTIFERASALFESIGAPVWQERAAQELRRVPIRRATATEALTPTEEQVAALAAAGHTNREVAHTLHMSPKTVEANLSRIYGKLGIRSRAELGARMRERRARA